VGANYRIGYPSWRKEVWLLTMAAFIPEKLTLRVMACGNLCLELTETLGWEDFPEFANELLALLDGTVLSKADGVETCLWEVRIQGCDFSLVYDDYPNMVSLASLSIEGDVLLRDLQQTLRSKFKWKGRSDDYAV
jgi:hypothetical protein